VDSPPGLDDSTPPVALAPGTEATTPVPPPGPRSTTGLLAPPHLKEWAAGCKRHHSRSPSDTSRSPTESPLGRPPQQRPRRFVDLDASGTTTSSSSTSGEESDDSSLQDALDSLMEALEAPPADSRPTTSPMFCEIATRRQSPPPETAPAGSAIQRPPEAEAQQQRIQPPQQRQRNTKRAETTTRLLYDPTGAWRNRPVDLLLAISRLAPGVEVRNLRETPAGPLLTITSVETLHAAVSSAEAFTACFLAPPTKPRPTLEVTLRVPAAIPADSIRDDLRRSVGDDVLAVRRLHAFTEGRVDRDRPLPRVIVTVRGEATAERVRLTPLFGALKTDAGAPTALPQVAQCRRCFGWSHRAAACRSRRRCIRCGDTSHLSEACSVPREETRCLGCSGDHAATWRGCPLRLKAVREALQARRGGNLAPTTTRPRTFARTRISDGLTFALAAAASNRPPPPPPTPHPTTTEVSAMETDEAAPPTTSSRPRRGKRGAGRQLGLGPWTLGPATEPELAQEVPDTPALEPAEPHRQPATAPARPDPTPLERAAKMRELAILLREAHTRLADAERSSREAAEEWLCRRTQASRRARDRARERCRRLRKRVTTLQTQQAAVRNTFAAQPAPLQTQASRPTPQPQPQHQPRQRQQLLQPTTTPTPKPPQHQRPSWTPPEEERSARPADAATPLVTSQANCVHLLAELTANLQTLTRHTSDPAAALCAVNGILDAFTRLLQSLSPHNVQ
jgi:hypothetical protein